MSIKPIKIAACKGVGPFSAASLLPSPVFLPFSSLFVLPSSFPRIQSNVATLPDKSRYTKQKRRNALTGSKRLSVFLRHFRCDSLSLSFSLALCPSFYRIGNSTLDILWPSTYLWSIFINLRVKIKFETVETDFRHL